MFYCSRCGASTPSTCTCKDEKKPVGIDIEKSKAICEAATWEPWVAKDVGGHWRIDCGDSDHDGFKHHSEANAKFIAHARTALPLALTEIEAKDREIERLREALQRFVDTHKSMGSDGDINFDIAEIGGLSVYEQACAALPGGKE